MRPRALVTCSAPLGGVRGRPIGGGPRAAQAELARGEEKARRGRPGRQHQLAAAEQAKQAHAGAERRAEAGLEHHAAERDVAQGAARHRWEGERAEGSPDDRRERPQRPQARRADDEELQGERDAYREARPNQSAAAREAQEADGGVKRCGGQGTWVRVEGGLRLTLKLGCERTRWMRGKASYHGSLVSVSAR